MKVKFEKFGLIYPNGNLVGMGHNSGGYPFYALHPAEIYYWYRKEAAEKYAKSFLDLKIVKIQISIEEL